MFSITGSEHQHVAAHVLQGVGAWASQHRDKVNPEAGSLREASARPEDNDSTDRVKLTNYHYHHYRASHHDVGSRANGHGSLADPARPLVYGPHTTPRTPSLDADMRLFQAKRCSRDEYQARTAPEPSSAASSHHQILPIYRLDYPSTKPRQAISLQPPQPAPPAPTVYAVTKWPMAPSTRCAAAQPQPSDH